MTPIDRMEKMLADYDAGKIGGFVFMVRYRIALTELKKQRCTIESLKEELTNKGDTIGRQQSEIQALKPEWVIAVPYLYLHRFEDFFGEDMVVSKEMPMDGTEYETIPLFTHPAPTPEEVKDAARLDWIESRIKEVSSVWIIPAGPKFRFVQVRDPDCKNYPTAGDIRAAIDAAMAAQKDAK